MYIIKSTDDTIIISDGVEMGIFTIVWTDSDTGWWIRRNDGVDFDVFELPLLMSCYNWREDVPSFDEDRIRANWQAIRAEIMGAEPSAN